MSASAGKVLLIPKGDYDNTATYEVLNWVRYNEKAYVCKQTTTGHLPTDTTYWQMLVQDGTSPNTKVSYFDNGILGSKNIIKLEATSQTLEGITYTVDKTTGIITASGTSSANGSYLEIYADTLPAGDYKKSGCPSGGSASTYHFAGSNTGDDTGSGATFTLSAATSCQFVIAIEPNQTVNLEFKPQLQLGTDIDDTFRPPALTNRELTMEVDDLDLTKAEKTELDTSIGPAYASVNNSVYTVVFDDLSDSYGYQLAMNDGLGAFQTVRKTSGTNSGIKLTYTINSTFTNISNGQTNTVQTGSGGTPFYLRVLK